jgi:hypothetical protein
MEDILDKLANNKEIFLKVKLAPQASTVGFMGRLADGSVKIAVKSVPEQGRANQELIKFLARALKVPATNIKIISGAGARLKLIKIVR